MGRKKKKPGYDSAKVMEELFIAISDSYHNPGSGEAVDGHKKLELLADEFEMSRLKVRKILITTGDYNSSDVRKASELRRVGLKTHQIATEMGIASCTVTSLLPYEKTVYKLEEISTAAERVKLYRERKAAVEDLKVERSSIALWKAIIVFSNYPFVTSGRGSRPGVKFQYSVPSSPSAAGKQYSGESVKGYGNEIMIDGREKSITRSSVDYALEIALTQEIIGPKQLKVYGSSYIFAIFRRFGLV